MAYTKFHTDWQAKPSTVTPITDVALEHIEAGIAAATADRFPVEDYGAVGNGTTNDQAAFAAAASAAAGVGWVVLKPGKTYALAAQWVLPSNTRIWAYGATIKATSTGSSDRVVYCSDVSNIRIHGLTIDGNKAAFAGTTEQRHGIHLIGASNVILVDVTSSSNKGDGLYIGRGTSAGCTDVIVERGVFNANHRNAMSVVDLVRARFLDCDFTNTTGTTPQDGVDIEPNVTANTVTDLLFRGCRMTGNSGDGAAHNRLSTGVTPTVARIRYQHCTIKGNGLRGVIVSYGDRLDFIECDVESNAGHAYSFEPTANAADYSIRGGSIRSNLRVAVKTTPAASMNLARLLVEGVSILDNSTEGAGTWEAIDIGARTTFVTIANNLIINTVGGVGMDSPVKTADTTVTDVTLIGNRYQTISAVSLADESASRINLTGTNG